MKLRNKKTGEIVEPFGITCVNGRTFVQFDDEKGTFKFEAHSLAELNEEWEDYEELPESYWVIEPYGKVECIKIDRHWSKDLYQQFKDFGNCFETKEEAEQTVEKLKAWKRLKDNDISFEAKVIDGRWYLGLKVEPKQRTFDEVNDLFEDIMFIFGGEE